MAKSIAECILFKYFFPDHKDKKKQIKCSEEYLKDMNFSLPTGLVNQATDKLNIKPENVSQTLSYNLGNLL